MCRRPRRAAAAAQRTAGARSSQVLVSSSRCQTCVIPCPSCSSCSLIIPGYIGGRMIKWLEEITVTEVGARAAATGACAASWQLCRQFETRTRPSNPTPNSHHHPQIESQNYYHFHDNRVLPSHVDEALANKEGEQRRGESLSGQGSQFRGHWRIPYQQAWCI